MGIPPAYWPSSGNLRVENLCAMYTLVRCPAICNSLTTLHLTSILSQDGPKVLHNLSFEIKSGERVGVGTYEFTAPRFVVNILILWQWDVQVPER